ncbi:MAG: aldehyde dehydrogenase family protein [Acidimicrobiales bacterium]|jgi:acyl-CoA reductase-like NAD-dependent aldehyde dehydrogenase|nr:aldehyde dehydrogenase family protein [Acidimicrobiales bacterium]
MSAPDPQTEYKLLIGGEWVTPGDGTYDIVNPATAQVVGHAPNASVHDAEAAAQAAAEAFPAWSRTSPAERAALLVRAAELLEARFEEFVPLVQAETGATMRVAKQMQVPAAAARFRRYAQGIAEELEIPLPPGIMPTTALGPGGIMGAVARRAPVGVVVAITSYNFPMTNMAGKLGPALAMGNTVVVKPAPQDPLAIVKLGEVFTEAGFPPGVVNVIVSENPTPAEALVASPNVDMVSFTGSTGVGQRIGAVAGHDMKRLLLELGGKGACIVFDDADLKAAITAITSVWAFHSGQICTAPTRVLAQRGIYDQLVEGLKGSAGFLKVGDPLERDTVLGPVITEAHRARVESYVAAGRDEGGTIVTGGERPDLGGWFVQPTLIADCRSGMRVVQEEIFGPVIVVVPFDDEEEAVPLANSTEFGLYDYVFSTDSSKAYRTATQLRTGNVGINSVQRNHEAPFGGFKMSGVGRDGGRFGFHAYSELQSIVWPG